MLSILALTFFSSCDEDNSVDIIETPEVVELEFRMNVNGAELVTDAFAHFCTTDTSEAVTISNKQSLLGGGPTSTEDFEEGDFVYSNLSSGTSNFTLGTQVLPTSVTGEEVTWISTSTEAVMDIESNDGNVIVGSIEGTLGYIDFDSGEFFEYPYTAEFTAEIVGSATIFCE
ncbi:MAG: hypothetical protein AAGF87_01360 [Bacteroidota bacterium]